MVDVDQMRADLLVARKTRDSVSEVALKRALALFSNAEAPPAQNVENYVAPPGPTEVPRLVLTEDDRRRLLESEIADADLASRQYAEAGHRDAAERLRAETDVLRPYLASGGISPPTGLG